METQMMKRCFGYNYTQLNSNDEGRLVHNTVSENVEIDTEKTLFTNTFVLVVEVAFGNTHMDLRDQQPTSDTIETGRPSSAAYKGWLKEPNTKYKYVSYTVHSSHRCLIGFPLLVMVMFQPAVTRDLRSRCLYLT